MHVIWPSQGNYSVIQILNDMHECMTILCQQHILHYSFDTQEIFLWPKKHHQTVTDDSTSKSTIQRGQVSDPQMLNLKPQRAMSYIQMIISLSGEFFIHT